MSVAKEFMLRKETIFSDLTALCEFFREMKNFSESVVLAKYQRVASLEKEFQDLFTEIIKYNSTVEKKEEISLRERANFVDLIDTIRSAFYKYEKDKTNESSLEVTEAKTVSTSILPKVNIPRFDGSIEKWIEFKTLFDSLIHNNPQISKEQKFHFLKNNLSGEASASISAFTVEADNYENAYRTIIDRYESPRRLGNYYIQLIKKYRITPSLNPQKFLNAHQVAINALKSLKIPNLADFILFTLLYDNLDASTQQAFDLKIGDTRNIPKTEELLEYITLVAKTEELKRDIQGKVPQSTKAHFSKINYDKNYRHKTQCSYCKLPHFLAYCPKFKEKSLIERNGFVENGNLCKNCLGQHSLRDCISKKSCLICKERHHSLLHKNTGISSAPSVVANHLNFYNKSTLLATATILIKHEGYTPVRALIDQGSEASFISESLVQGLNLRRSYSTEYVSGIGSTQNTKTRGSLWLEFKSRFNENIFRTRALILPKLTAYIPPAANINGLKFENLNLEELADEDLLSNKKGIEVILGAELFSKLMLEGVQKSSDGLILAQQTELGWILSGALTNPVKGQYTTHCSSVEKNLLNAVQKFWNLEEPELIKSKEEVLCEEHFRATISRNKEGRFIVRLPFKEDPAALGESKNSAFRALHVCQNKLQKNPQLSELYHQFIQEYNDLSHMEIINESEIPKYHYFLPHHGVLRPSSSTTKLRVVFNASKVTSSGKSLNDILYIGPSLLPNIQDLVLRWRKHKIVFSADIEKMFRQILVHPDDQFFQLILWKNEIYRLKTVTYGTACAPYLAIRTLRQLAEEEKDFPLASQILNEDIYMDDVLSGANDVEEALQKQKQLIELLNKGDFPLRKWTSNSKELLNHLPEQLKAHAVERDCFPSEEHSMLGIKWHSEQDLLILKSNFKELTETINKRVVLSAIAKLFDPLGYAAPVLIKAKIFLQSLWLVKINWDDNLSPELALEWKNIYDDFSNIHLKIPRWVGFGADLQRVSVHGFADASEKAMAAVVYLKIENNRNCKINLIGAKTKVAPLKNISLPRLELTAAFHLTKLVKNLISALKIPQIDDVRLWTDSTITLHWIRGSPSKWTTFVGNRVAEIQRSTPTATWAFVPTDENPADCATRGLKNSDLQKHNLWWSGPAWLELDHSCWPLQPKVLTVENLEERKKKPAFIHIGTILTNWIEKFSEYPKLLRITAYCLRYIYKLKRKSNSKGVLSAQEIYHARSRLIKEVQNTSFSKEIKCLEGGSLIPRQSPLIALNPTLDEEKLLRVGGRLKHSALSFNEKFPLILPSKHHFVTLIIRDAHKRTLHGGTQLTLATLRQEFWILKGRQAVKSVIKRCVVCQRYRGSQLYQKMGDLPKERVIPSRPFQHSGVDFAGPIQLRTSKGRGQKSYKGYIAVFVCFFTRAIHLEAVSDYTAESFLAAYRRFTARRGVCSTLRSDRGTNFIGAASLMKSLFDQSSNSGRKIADTLATDFTEWKFNPPSAPHFGGLWEAAVKSVKYHIKRVLKDTTLTFEEMSTLLCQVEAILNSRPLQPLSDDPEDVSTLTPAHFLLGAPMRTIPDPTSDAHSTSLACRWKMVQNQRQSFWKTWSEHYIQQLQSRQKWEFPNLEIAEGDLVLIKNENTSPCKWPLARVTQIHRGPDNLVRVVTLKTAKSEIIQRPIVKLCPLMKSTSLEAVAAAHHSRKQLNKD